MKLLVVTGSRGFIGRHLVRAFRDDHLEVVGTGRTEEKAAGPYGSRYQRLLSGAPEMLLPGDLAGRPFTLVHLAWATSRPPQYTPHVGQVCHLAELLDYWSPRGLEAVVMPGTAEEYGRRSGRFREDDTPIGPLTANGWAKEAVRELLRNWSAANGRQAIWLRPFIVYGPGQEGNMVLPYALRQVMAGQTADLSDGLQQRDFVYVDDVVEAFRAAVACHESGFQAVNIGSSIPVTVREVLEHVADLLGGRQLLRFGVVPRRPGEPPLQVADTGRAEALFGWRARVGWREGLSCLCASLRKVA